MSFFNLQIVGNLFFSKASIDGLLRFAYTAFLKGASLIGPVKSSLLASIEPISAVFFAFLIMNEQFYPIDFLGMAMILFAVTLISLKDLLLEK